jgi:hypothetical protein
MTKGLFRTLHGLLAMTMNIWFSSKFIVFVCVLLSSFPASAMEDVAGVVKTARGSVQVERDAKLQTLAVGDKVYQNDRIFTGSTSSVGITLNDDTRMSLGSSSSFKLAKFVYNQNTGKGNLIGSVLKGTFRFVTGVIGKLSPESVTIKTRSATIGILGTDFIVNVGDQDEAANAK